MTLHLTLKMTTAQVVKMSVTNNSLSEDYSHPDAHTRQTTDTPGFKLFANRWFSLRDYPHPGDHAKQIMLGDSMYSNIGALYTVYIYCFNVLIY